MPVRYVCGLVAYDGTDFAGFQFQPDTPTVQGELERALGRCANPASRVVGAGRTDSGVHARGQVVAVRVKWRHDVTKLLRAWNAYLPPAIAVRSLGIAPERFHPRFCALNRTYRYTVVEAGREQVALAPRRSPLTDRFAWHVLQRLDLGAMQEASRHLVGDMDYATFGHPTQGESTVRQVTVAEWHEVQESLVPLDDTAGRRFVFTITANGFLRQMVRRIVGSLVRVGQGIWQPDDMARLIASRDIGRSAPPAPASGLVLERVEYPAEVGVIPSAAIRYPAGSSADGYSATA